jgi:two-component system KDP operon response regulator KdpE
MQVKGSACVVVVCEDDVFSRRLERWLAERGYEVIRAENSWEAYRCIYVSRPAAVIIVIDRLSREIQDFVHTLKKMTPLPLLLLSYSPSRYLLSEVKSWPLDGRLQWDVEQEEIPPALEGLLRRLVATPSDQLTYEEDGLFIDFRSMSVWANGQPVHLTPTEFRILGLLVGRRGWVVTHDEILSHVWGSEYLGDKGLVKLYIWYLRRKMEPDPHNPRWILTRHGVGYMFAPGRATSAQKSASAQKGTGAKGEPGRRRRRRPGLRRAAVQPGA